MFDDAVAVKPLRTTCTQNILITDCKVIYGVGMSIGSVPPNLGINCVNNITIRNIDFQWPLKAIYLKSNPGVNGRGLISNILYENIKITNAITWAI